MGTCLTDIRVVLVLQYEEFWRSAAQQCECTEHILLISKSVHLEMVMIINFMLYMLYHNF